MSGALWGAGVAAVWALWYAASCWWFPFKPHARCKGTGRIHREDRKVHRLCRRCKGTGRRLRIGRRVWNYATRLRREGT